MLLTAAADESNKKSAPPKSILYLNISSPLLNCAPLFHECMVNYYHNTMYSWEFPIPYTT
uniref:Uncharacterized protein n=1 Tax=Arundo donax TaxID=35708 RepID=A0A0A9GH49_ARUDO